MIKNRTGIWKRIVVTFLILSFVMGFIQVPSVEAAMSKEKQHKIYQEVIEKYDKKVKKIAKKMNSTYESNEIVENWYKNSKTYYVYADLNKDGIDECIVRYESSEDEHNTALHTYFADSTTIYTIHSNKVKILVDNTNVEPPFFDMCCGWCVYKKYIGYVYHDGSNGIIFNKLQNGKLKKIYDLNEVNRIEGDEYRINGKKVSKSVYDKKYKELTSNKTGYTMKKY